MQAGAWTRLDATLVPPSPNRNRSVAASAFYQVAESGLLNPLQVVVRPPAAGDAGCCRGFDDTLAEVRRIAYHGENVREQGLVSLVYVLDNLCVAMTLAGREWTLGIACPVAASPAGLAGRVGLSRPYRRA